MSVVNGSCYLVHTLLSGDGAQGGARVEVVEVESQEAAAAQLVHQQSLALLKHIWVQHGTQTRGGCQARTGDDVEQIKIRQRGKVTNVERERETGHPSQCLTNPL